MHARSFVQLVLFSSLFFCFQGDTIVAQEIQPKPEKLKIAWSKNYLTIGGKFPGEKIEIHYLEAYCRNGSTDQDWGKTVIKHKAELIAHDRKARIINLKDTLQDGVVVHHTITASYDEIDFQIVAKNETKNDSDAHWAQPCMRVDRFTGAGKADMREKIPAYARQCFLFVDDKLTMLPTEPWNEKARYVFGQVYVPKGVDRNDVNPRPLSEIVPSNYLCGCFSADRKMILAVAFEPCQEIFQGVIACFHNDFRIGGLKAGESKKIHGKIYIVPNDPEKLLARYKADFESKK